MLPVKLRKASSGNKQETCKIASSLSVENLGVDLFEERINKLVKIDFQLSFQKLPYVMNWNKTFSL